jgi:hypothetical protein
MVVKVLGTVMFASLVVDANAEVPMLVTPSGITRLVSFDAPWNALFPMLFKVLGKLMLVSVVAFLNALLAIAVTVALLIDEGIVTDAGQVAEHPVTVADDPVIEYFRAVSTVHETVAA